MSVERPLHAGAWLLWAAAALVALTVTRNPIYIGLALLWVGVTLAIVRGRPAVPGLHTLSPLRFALVVVPMAALLNMLFVHVGGTRLFILPDGIPLIGGAITAEALTYGALNGLVLTGIFAAFAVFNLMTPVRALVRLVPRAYYPVAVTLAIAVTFVPVTLRQAEQIREAQAVRGARLTGLSAWLPLFLPLLSSGLERALQLAEAMAARGFAAGATGQDKNGDASIARTQVLLLLGIVLAVAGWLLGIAKWPAGGGGAAVILRYAIPAAGVLLIVAALRRAGQNFPHTVYRPAPWAMREWMVAGSAALVTMVFLLPIPGIDRSALAWSPYPLLSMPPFSALFALASWGLLAPVALLLAERTP